MVEPSPFLVTTLIPTFRRPELLRRAIISAREQQGPGVRIKVFDNDSGDETPAVVAALAQGHADLQYHRHGSNLGAAGNFAFAVRSVETPYFSILSDDDYLLPGFYARAVDALERYRDAAFWAGITLNVDACGKVWDARVAGWPREGLYPPPEGAFLMTSGRAPVWTGVLFRADVLTGWEYPDHEAGGPFDLDFLLRLAAIRSFILEKHPAAVFSLNPESFSATQPLSAFWPGWLKMFDNVAAMDTLAPEHRERLLTSLRADARRMLFRRGVNAVALGRGDFARDAARELATHYSATWQVAVLRSLSAATQAVRPLGHLFSAAYGWTESRLIKSRGVLDEQYGSLLR